MTTTLSSGHTVEDIDEETMAQYKKDFTGCTGHMIKLQPGGWALPSGFLRYADKLHNFKFRPNDVVIMTYQKCGTTWMQEIVWTMMNNPNLDNPSAGEALYFRSPYIDMDMLFAPPEGSGVLSEMLHSMMFLMDPIYRGFFWKCPFRNPVNGMMLQLADVAPDNRTLKTHLPFSLLPKDLLDTCKVIFVARNPKDTVLSYQHHCKLLKPHGFVGTQDTFMQYFMDDLLYYGSYPAILKEAWERRNHPNMHLVFYEDLKANTEQELQTLNEFIGTSLTKEQLNNVQQKTSFKTMKATDPLKISNSGVVDKAVQEKDGSFFRQGQAGSWQGKLTAEQEAKIDEWTERNFKDTGIVFKYK